MSPSPVASLGLIGFAILSSASAGALTGSRLGWLRTQLIEHPWRFFFAGLLIMYVSIPSPTWGAPRESPLWLPVFLFGIFLVSCALTQAVRVGLTPARRKEPFLLVAGFLCAFLPQFLATRGGRTPTNPVTLLGIVLSGVLLANRIEAQRRARKVRQD